MPLFNVSLRCESRSSTGGRGLAQPRLESGRVELGGREQCAKFVVQFAGEMVALVFANRLQMAGELLELRGPGRHLRFQAVSLGSGALVFFAHCPVELQRRSQVHEKSEQADRCHGRDADAVEHQGLIDRRSALHHGVGLVDQKPLGKRDDALHLLAPDLAHDELAPGGASAGIVQLDGGGELAELFLARSDQLPSEAGGSGIAGVACLDAVASALRIGACASR